MSGYCKWCHTLTNSIVKEYELGVLVWVGCSDCCVKKKEIAKHAKKV